MTPIRIFVSSVQSEFAPERVALRDYLREDPLLRRFFDVFLFEDVPASDRRPDDLYLDEVERCDVYVGLFGLRYGHEDEAGIAPTEREFDRATASGAHRLIFVKGPLDATRHPKMQALIGKAESGLIRKRFSAPEELKTGLYAALVEYLEVKELIRRVPFDAAPCEDAVLDDLDDEHMAGFVRTARNVRQFPLSDRTAPADLLAHLNLLKDGRPTNAAVLLFGKAPQRFLIASEVRCAHFHGTEVEKPIPSYQVYKGTVFQLVDQAVDFVLGKLDRAIGTRAESVRAARTYEIPPEVVTEAIVNAVAHRDYTDNGSVQVMLFADRLEVRNPGRLPPPLTFDMLRVAHRSIPGNPLLAEPLYLAEYIERMGTGTLDMIRRCAAAGLPEPEFAVTGGFVATIRRLPPAARMAQASQGGRSSDAAERKFHECVSAEVRTVADGPDRFRVFTPFRFDDGDHLVIVLKKEGDGWVLSDEAHTWMHLSLDGDERGRYEGAREKVVSGVLSRFGVEDRDGELVADVPDYRRGEAFYTFAQALIEIHAVITSARADGLERGRARGGRPSGGQAGHAMGQVGGQAGHAEGQVGGQVRSQDEGHAILSTKDAAMLRACGRETVPGEELQAAADYSRRTGDFRRRLERLLNRGLLEMTIPGKPRSPLQKYRMTARGKAVLDASMGGDKAVK